MRLSACRSSGRTCGREPWRCIDPTLCGSNASRCVARARKTDRFAQGRGLPGPTSDRPYRKAMPRSDALRALQENAGSQFDPLAVDALVAALESGEPEAAVAG